MEGAHKKMSNNSYCITVDSTADMPASYYKEENIDVLPYTYTINGEAFLDYQLSEEDYEAFFKRIRDEKVVPKTTQVNIAQYEEFFENKLKNGQDVIHLHFSSVLSGSFQNAQIVVRELREKYPDRKIEVIDTQSATLGLAVILWHAVKKQKEGLSFEEMVEFVNEIRTKACHHFTVADLNYLSMGGRLSKSQAFIGSMLNVKPILEISKEGYVNVIGKVRGKKAAFNKLVDLFCENYDPNRSEIVFIVHSLCLQDAKELAKAIQEKTGLTNFFFHSVGPVIGTHTGVGAFGPMYIGKSR